MEVCCVCLRDGTEVRVSRATAAASALFVNTLRIAGISETDTYDAVYVCEWCAACVRTAHIVCSNMGNVAKVLTSFYSACRDGLPFNETLIKNAKTVLLKPLKILSITRIEYINIGNCCDSDDQIDIENIERSEIDDNAMCSDDDEEKYMKELQESEIIVDAIDLKEKINVNSEKINPSDKLIRKTRTKTDEKIKRNLKDNKIDEETQFEVIYLSYEEQVQEIVERRQSEKFTNSKFKCDDCAVGFTTEDVFTNHMRRHEKSSGLHKCDICKLYFGKKEVQLQHSLAHRRHYRCLRCSAVVRRRCHCAEHRARCCAVASPAVCECCNKIFRDTYSLKQHMRDVHLKEETFECHYCNKMFKHKQKLIVHIRCHTGEKPYKCVTCNKKFSTNSNLTAHTVVHDLIRQYYCVECDAYFKTAKGLKRHYETSKAHQNLDSLSFQCSSCPQKFVNAKRLEAHRAFIHLGRVNYSCDICAKGFGSSSNLNKHIRAVHHKVKGARDKMCDVCGKSFALNRTLQSHRDTHSGVRPYSCDYCDEKFTQKSTQYNHIKSVHSLNKICS